MPHLRIRGIDATPIRALSHALLDQMETIIQAPRDWFSIEVISSLYLFDGIEKSPGPIVEFLWFDRGRAVQDRVALAITDLLRPHVPQGQDITVIFVPLQKHHYYENGRCMDT